MGEVNRVALREHALVAQAAIESLLKALDDAPAPAPDDKLDVLGAIIDTMGAPIADPDQPTRPIAWGAKVSHTFRRRIWWTCNTLGLDPDWLMACIAFETGERFSANVRNAAGSGATGLIQFMPATARGLGTSVEALAALSAEDQIVWVYRYFRPYAGRLHSLADTYMAILLPSAIGKPDDAPLFSGGVAYRQNSGLDANRDGKVTKIEAAAKVLQKLAKGRKPENMK